jgi:hypothetical protein
MGDAMAEQWEPESERAGVLSRLLVPESGAKPATTALVVGMLAVVAFVTSVVLDWIEVTQTLPTGDSLGIQSGSQIVAAGAPGTIETLSQVYLFGMVALLGLLGAVVMRPDLALRLRMAATGVAVGLLGVVVAYVLRFPDAALGTIFGGIFGMARFDAVTANQAVAYQPGVAAAVVAVGLTVAGVWLAARPAARALAAAPSRRYAVAPAAPGLAGDPASPAEPLDLSVTPDAWRP